MTHEQFSKKRALITAIKRGTSVLISIDKYERDNKKQGMLIQLDHEYYRSLVTVCFPEIEQEVLELLKSRYTQMVQMWEQELKNLLGEITR